MHSMNKSEPKSGSTLPGVLRYLVESTAVLEREYWGDLTVPIYDFLKTRHQVLQGRKRHWNLSTLSVVSCPALDAIVGCIIQCPHMWYVSMYDWNLKELKDTWLFHRSVEMKYHWKGLILIFGMMYICRKNILYSVAYTIKMSKMGDHGIEGYFDFVFPPLEGLWWQEEDGKPAAAFPPWNLPEWSPWQEVVETGQVVPFGHWHSAKFSQNEQIPFILAEFLWGSINYFLCLS